MITAAFVCVLLVQRIEVSSDYEGGSIGRVESVGPAHLRCAVAGQTDRAGRNRQASWYDFRLENVPIDRPLRIDLVDLVGEYNFHPAAHAVTRHTRPVVSTDDRRTWRHLRDDEVEWDDARKVLSLRFQPDAETLWIAHIPPYSNSNLQRLESEFRDHPALNRTSAGQTPDGRPIALWTITDPERPDDGKKVIWCMARQHAWGAGSSWVAEGMIRFLLSDAPDACSIRRRVLFKIFPMADPDGVAHGRVRFNAEGHDLNRNWDAVDPHEMPEIAFQRCAISDWLDAGHRIDLFLTIHNTEAADYLQGPIRDGGEALRQIADRLHRDLSQSPTFDAPDGPRDLNRSEPTTPPGRQTVNEALFRRFGVPAFLIELRVENAPKLGRSATIADRLDFGVDLARALAAAVEPEFRSP